MYIDSKLLNRLFRYDPETGKLFWKEREPDMLPPNERDPVWRCRNWNSRWAGEEAFTAVISTNGYCHGNLFGKRYVAHRIIWCMVMGEWPEFIDHINGDRADNRWENLREVTKTENCRNVAISSQNTSGVVGVHFWNLRKKWVASIKVNGKTISLGNYENFDDAVKARKEGEIKYGFHPNHGEKRKSYRKEAA